MWDMNYPQIMPHVSFASKSGGGEVMFPSSHGSAAHVRRYVSADCVYRLQYTWLMCIQLGREW